MTARDHLWCELRLQDDVTCFTTSDHCFITEVHHWGLRLLISNTPRVAGQMRNATATP